MQFGSLTFPQPRQWCLLLFQENFSAHMEHMGKSESGVHEGVSSMFVLSTWKLNPGEREEKDSNHMRPYALVVMLFVINRCRII